MIEYVTFTDATQNIVRKLTDRAFLPASAELVRKFLANPLRRLDPDAGNLAVEDGVPVAFQAAVVRKVVSCGEEIPAMTGGMLSSVPGTDPLVIFEIVKQSTRPRAGSLLYFGNTACKAALRLNKLRGISGTGPASCAIQRLQPIHWTRFAWYLFVHKVFKCQNLGGRKLTSTIKAFRLSFGHDEVRYLPEVDEREWTDFWTRYKCGISGLTSSRTFEEMSWAFKGLRWCALGYYREGRLAGCVVLKSGDEHGNRWSIADWLAIGNDENVLDRLLVAAKNFLRRRTHAMLFQTTGFPTFIQPVLARHFKYTRPLYSNEFLYRFDDEAIKEKVMPVMDTKDSWFFGPYDGDACLF